MKTNNLTCFKCRESVPESIASILDIGLSCRNYLSGEQGAARRSSVILCPTCAKGIETALIRLERHISDDIYQINIG